MSRLMMQLASPRPASSAPDAIPQNTRKIPASEADYVGVGIVFDAQMRVLNLVKGGAAERSGGILRYDHLVAVDGRSMVAASTEQLKVAVRGPPGTSVVLTFKRNEQSASFDVPLVRSGLAAAPPVSPVKSPVAAPAAEPAPAAASAPAISNAAVFHALSSAIDAARSDLAQKDDDVSSLTRQLQSAAFLTERERAAAAAADARRAQLADVLQQLEEEAQVLQQQKEKVESVLPGKQQQALQSRVKVETMRDSLWEAEEAAIQAKAKLDEIDAAILEQQDLLQISSVHRLDAEAREEHLKGELLRREQLSAQAQQVDEADQKSLKERVAYLQQQLQKEEELAVSAKARLEQAQAARVVAEEDLAKQEALFADKQLRIQEADAMLTRGRAVQESVKEALSELQSVVLKLQDTKRSKDAALTELETLLSDVLARSDDIQASSASRIDEERARHAIACASLEQAAAELQAKLAQVEGEINQGQNLHEIEQEQLQLQQVLHTTEARARAAQESLVMMQLKVDETRHHKVHLANQAAALVDSWAQKLQTLEDLLARERATDSEISQAKDDSANRPLRLKVLQLKDDLAQMQSRVKGVTGEVAALRESVTKFWQDEAQSGPRDEAHRGRHAALLQQLQAVEQRSSSLYYLLDTLVSENQAFESHWDSPALPLPPSPQHSNDVVIGSGSDGYFGAVL